MRRRSRQRCRLFACLLLVGLAAGAAWHFGWIPVEIGGVNTGRLVGSTNTASQLGAGTDELGLPGRADSVGFDPSIFANQNHDSPLTTDHSPPEPAGVGFAPSTADADPAGGIRPAANIVVQATTVEQADNAKQTDTTEPKRPTPAATTRAPQEGEGPSHDAAATPDLKEIERLVASGQELAAYRELSKIYWYQPELRPQIREQLDAAARSIYFAPQPHYMEPYTVQPGDQLRKIATAYAVPWEYLTRLNRIDPKKIRAGQKLKVIKGPFAAVVDLSDFELTIHAHGHFVRSYRVGIGKDGSSPIGKLKVVQKVVNPQYTDPDGRVLDAADPANPLGERWIDLGNGYGIHGTLQPDSIGHAQSRGCIRLRNEDVEEVYDLLSIGSEVVIQR